jgi:hypothetical protein
MYIGTMKVYLILRQSRSLKDKRQVVSSIKEKLQQSFNISVAEVDLLDDRQQAVLGIAMVTAEDPRRPAFPPRRRAGPPRIPRRSRHPWGVSSILVQVQPFLTLPITNSVS